MALTQDWSRIRAEYVFGCAKDDGMRSYPTLAELAEKYDVSVSSVRHKASDEKWSKEREEAQYKAYYLLATQYEEELSLLVERVDHSVAKVAEMLIDFFIQMWEAASFEERKVLFNRSPKQLLELSEIAHRASDVQQLLLRLKNREEEEDDASEAQ
jgi:hypothetical protein